MNRFHRSAFLLPVLLAFLLSACGGGPEDTKVAAVPAGILSEEAFAAVLADFALAEGAANLNIKNAPAQRVDTVYAFDPLKDHGVRKAQYDSTILFYAEHTELYKKVYENVLALLSEMQTQKDSLRRDSVSK